MTRKGNVSSGVLLILPTSFTDFTVWYSQIACVAVGDGEKRKKGGRGGGLGRLPYRLLPKERLVTSSSSYANTGWYSNLLKII